MVLWLARPRSHGYPVVSPPTHRCGFMTDHLPETTEMLKEEYHNSECGAGQIEPTDSHCNYGALWPERALWSSLLPWTLGWDAETLLIILGCFSLEDLFKPRLLSPVPRIQMQEGMFLISFHVMVLPLVQTTLWETLSNHLMPSLKRPQTDLCLASVLYQDECCF